jgi:3-deoxy-D-manno-octulosonic-acid transferase
MLNTLYQYGHLAYIGGGFGKGIHNTLEPAAYGLPILFGPEFEKFEEAKQFVQKGAAFVVYHSEDLTARLEQLEDRRQWQKSSKAVVAYLQENQGATETILDWIKQRFFDPAGSEQPKFW